MMQYWTLLVVGVVIFGGAIAFALVLMLRSVHSTPVNVVGQRAASGVPLPYVESPGNRTFLKKSLLALKPGGRSQPSGHTPARRPRRGAGALRANPSDWETDPYATTDVQKSPAFWGGAKT